LIIANSGTMLIITNCQQYWLATSKRLCLWEYDIILLLFIISASLANMWLWMARSVSTWLLSTSWQWLGKKS